MLQAAKSVVNTFYKNMSKRLRKDEVMFSISEMSQSNLGMARERHTADDLEAMAADLVAAANSLTEIAQHMRSNGLPHSLIHGTTAKTVYVPSLLDWIDKARADTHAQVRAYLTGVESRAEQLKKINEAAKLAAGRKKAVNKKASKDEK